MRLLGARGAEPLAAITACPVSRQPQECTEAAIARLDAQFPWLRGAERRSATLGSRRRETEYARRRPFAHNTTHVGAENHRRFRSSPVTVTVAINRSLERTGVAIWPVSRSEALTDPWPGDWSENWYASDDIYVDYDYNDAGYYLYNRRYHGERLAITIVL